MTIILTSEFFPVWRNYFDENHMSVIYTYAIFVDLTYTAYLLYTYKKKKLQENNLYNISLREVNSVEIGYFMFLTNRPIRTYKEIWKNPI